MLANITKRSGDTLDYPIGFGKWLTDDDEITSAVAVVTPPGELVIEKISIANPDVSVWASGGAEQSTYTILVTAATQGGRIKEVEFTIRIRD